MWSNRPKDTWKDKVHEALCSPPLIILHTHIFIFTPTQVNTHKHRAHTPPCAIRSLSQTLLARHCLSWQTHARPHTHLHKNPWLVLLSLSCAFAHSMLYVDSALGHDKVHADRWLSTLQGAIYLRNNQVCVFVEENVSAGARSETKSWCKMWRAITSLKKHEIRWS